MFLDARKISAPGVQGHVCNFREETNPPPPHWRVFFDVLKKVTTKLKLEAQDSSNFEKVRALAWNTAFCEALLGPKNTVDAILMEATLLMPRITRLSDVRSSEVYVGFSVMPAEETWDRVTRKALFGSFPSVADATTATTLLRSFCAACNTGLVMPDIIRGDGEKLVVWGRSEPIPGYRMAIDKFVENPA